MLTGLHPELYIAVLGGLKAGCVVSPLFSAFGPEPIATRIGIGEGAVLVTTDLLYERKVAKLRDRLPSPAPCPAGGWEDGATPSPPPRTSPR